MGRFRFATRSIALPALSALVGGCSAGDGHKTNDLGTDVEKSVTKSQTPLDGNSVQKFFTQLPIVRRVTGNGPLQVVMQEFQQKVLPAPFYARLAAPFNAG